MSTTYTIKGRDAIRLAERDALTLYKFADPTEGEQTVTPDEARAIAREDANLIYVTVQPVGWTEGDGSGHEGYQVSDYFVGRYSGPDYFDIEPTFTDAGECGVAIIAQIKAIPGVIDATWTTSPAADGPTIMVQCGPDVDLTKLPGGVIDGSSTDEDGCFDVVITLISQA